MCRSCRKRRLAKLAAGAVGLAKFVTGADAAPVDVIRARRLACRTCPLSSRSDRPAHARDHGLYAGSVCREDGGGCGCLIVAKTALASEACPLGWWLAVSTT